MESQINQNWTIIEIATKCPPKSWEQAFKDAEPELKHISYKLDIEKKLGDYFPNKEDIFSAFHATPLNNVKVVIIGQDPFHQAIYYDNRLIPRAVGKSFSVRKIDNVPVSTVNIYKELQRSIPTFKIPNHGCLDEWTEQGVLLLNLCLTVKKDNAGSHSKYNIWMDFIVKMIKAIITVNPTTIFIMWGKESQQLSTILPESCIQLLSSHPSGFSVNRGFSGCNHFNLVNEQLTKQGKSPINWSIT